MTIHAMPTGAPPINLIIDTACGLGYWPEESLVIALYAVRRDGAAERVLAMRCNLSDIKSADTEGDATGWRDYVASVVSRTDADFADVLLIDPAQSEHWQAVTVATEAMMLADVDIRDIVVALSHADHLAWTRLDGQAPLVLDEHPWQTMPWSDAEALAGGARDWRLSRGDLVAEIRSHDNADLRGVIDLADEAARDDAIVAAGTYLCSEAATGGAAAESGDAARFADEQVLGALADVRIRDTVIWDLLQRPSQQWSEAANRLVPLVQRAAPGHVAPVATILGLLRWQLGDGTRASIALDRALADNPDYTLGRLIDGCLQAGIAPTMWREGLGSLSREQCRRPG